MSKVEASEIVDYLNDYLDIVNVPDYPNAYNGLQVENSGKVQLLAACTDACQATIDAAAELDADLMIVHHGLFWDAGITPLAGRAYHRVKKLLDHDIAVYSSHLPLDAHPEVGNNAELARGLGLANVERFGEFQGRMIGFMGELKAGRDELSERIEELLGASPQLIPGGPPEVRRVGVVTGGAAQLIPQARAAGLDSFVTGEGGHHSYFDAHELGVNVFYAGHYATETLGVRALAAHVAEKFGIGWEFIDNPTGM